MEQKEKQNHAVIVPIPIIPDFQQSAISGIAPTLQSIDKFAKWNSQVVKTIDSAIDSMKNHKKGSTVLLKVTMQNQWGSAVLSNFVSTDIDDICLQVLEQNRRKILNDLELINKWKNSEEFEFEERFLIRIFNFYCGAYGIEFKALVSEIQSKVRELYPNHEFYKTLQFSLSQILMVGLERHRYELTQLHKSTQIIFKDNEEVGAAVKNTYGLFKESNKLLSLLKKKQHLNAYIEYLKNHPKCSSEELSQIISDYCHILQEKEQSIRSLNNLISNEEEELNYRQNQVEILSEQIKKMLNQQQDVKQLKVKIEGLEKKLKEKERSIVELNKLIGNEEEQLVFRENQVEILTEEIKKLMKMKQGSEHK